MSTENGNTGGRPEKEQFEDITLYMRTETKGRPSTTYRPYRLVGCLAMFIFLAAILALSPIFIRTMLVKGQDLGTTASYVDFFDQHRDCLAEAAAEVNEGRRPEFTPCLKEMKPVNFISTPLTLVMYVRGKADYKAFVYMGRRTPAKTSESMEAARRERPGGGSTYVPLGNGWYLVYSWD